MTSPTDRGDAAPSSPADPTEQKQPTAQSMSGVSGSSTSETARRRVWWRGTAPQRPCDPHWHAALWRETAAPAVPRPLNAPALGAKPDQELKDAQPKPPAPQAAAATDEASTAAAESAEETPQPADAPQPAASEEPPRKQSKKQGGGVPMLPPTRDRVAVPSVRAGLSEELELESSRSIGGQSIDQVIAEESKGTPKELEPDTRHRGPVIAVHRDNVFVDLGGRQQGVVQLKNFAEPPEVGTVLEVSVAKFDAAEGLYELTLPGGTVSVGDWSEVTEGMIVEARVTGHNKGGLECEVNQLRGFIPASQVSLYRVEDLAQFVGQKFTCVVTEANPEKRNLVLSRRAVLEREKAAAKESVLASLEVGKTLEGTVRSLQNFGAFVDLGGVDGLVHISQLSWDRLKHADEVSASRPEDQGQDPEDRSRDRQDRPRLPRSVRESLGERRTRLPDPQHA